jgi:hypothetical protein
MFRKFIFSVTLLCFYTRINAGVNPGKIFFIEPEWMTGWNIPIYDEFPECSLRQNLLLNFGYIHTDSLSNWVSYFNYPTIGISAVYSALGNREVFKSEFGLIPYILLKTSRNPHKSFDFKMGLGVTFDTHPYDKEHNPDNLVISTPFNWGFHLLVYKNILVRRKINVKMGFGLLHTSNGHTVLPNYGLNTLALSLAFLFPHGDYDPMFALKQPKLPLDRTKHYIIQARYGLGWHKFGGTTGPVGGPTYKVSSFALSGGIIFKQQAKIRTGITYRYYDSYYNYIRTTPDSLFRTNPGEYKQHPHLQASSLSVLFGCEFLIRHFGLDLEGNYNFYKPFYKEFNELYEYKKGSDYWISEHIALRLGVNYYLIDTSKKPRQNLLIGTHINANYFKAEFMDVSLAYVYMVK